MPRLFVYVVKEDFGFAPNPFFGYCTLATCKPKIRQVASVGDWVVGVTPKSRRDAGELVYAMCVEETLCFNQYWNDPRFDHKKPRLNGSLMYQYGDNVYHQLPGSPEWTLEECPHSIRNREAHIRSDTDAPVVLVSQTFSYFGDSAISVAPQFRNQAGFDILDIGRGHLSNFPSGFDTAFIGWLTTLPKNVLGEPSEWSEILRQRKPVKGQTSTGL